jgi:hypothetical protein
MDERLVNLSRNEPLIHSYLTLYELGDISYDEMLIQIILHLVQTTTDQFEMMTKLFAQSPKPIDLIDL